MEASGPEAGKQKQMGQDIWFSRTGLYLTESEPDDAAGGKQNFSGSPAFSLSRKINPLQRNTERDARGYSTEGRKMSAHASFGSSY